METLDLRKPGREPIRGLLGSNAPECSFPSDLKNDDAVVIVDDSFRAKDAYDLSWGPRCFDDPDRLKRPTILNSSLQR